MAVNRWPIEKMLSPSVLPPPIFVFSNLQSEKKFSPLLSGWLNLFLKKDCKSPCQYKHTIVFHVIINNNPPLLVSPQTFPKSPQITHTMCHKA